MGHIEGEQDPKAKALLCKGTAKLVLAGMITDADVNSFERSSINRYLTVWQVIKNLIKAYLSPLTVDNHELRQCLAFFLQMYSYSSPANQKRMREVCAVVNQVLLIADPPNLKIFIHVFFDLNQDRKLADTDGEEQPDMVSSAQVSAMFIDWTDPLRLSQAM